MKIIQLLLLLVAFSHIGFAQDHIDVVTVESTLIGDRAFYLEDLTHELSWQDVYREYKAENMERIETKVFNRPASNAITWAAFTLNNKTNEELWLHVAYSCIDYIDVYKLTEGGMLVEAFYGGAFRENENKFVDSYTFFYPLINANENQSFTFLVRTQMGSMREIPLQVGSLIKLNESRSRFTILSFLFIGGMIVIFLYNLTILFIVKDITYLYYGLYTLCITFATTFACNYPFLGDLIGAKLLNSYPSLIFSLTSVFISAVTIRLLDLKKEMPFFYRLLIGTVILTSLMGVSNLVFKQYQISSWSQLSAMLNISACILPCYISAFRKSRKGIILSIGWTIVFTGANILLFTVNGMLEYNYFNRNIFQICVLIEILIYSIVLALDFNDLKAEQVHLNEELNQKNEELLSSNASLDSFNYHVSHDLKTVLNNSSSLAKMIKKYNNLKDNNKVEEITSKLIKTTDSGKETIQSFLELSKIHNLSKTEAAEYIKVGEECESILRVYNFNNKVDFQITSGKEEVVYMHKRIFESMFVNLITNSIKYTTRFPVVKLSFKKGTEFDTFIYTDNGIGIDLTRDKDKLFQPFVRLKNDLKTDGTGIGLFMVKRMLESNGGKIQINSVLGEGSEFVVQIKSKGNNNN